MRHLGHDVRGGRHDEGQVRPFRVVDMGDVARRVLKQVVANRVTRESLKSGRSDEALGRRGAGDANNAPGLLKAAQDLTGLICGNASAYGKKDLLSSDLGHRYSPSWVVIRMRWQYGHSQISEPWAMSWYWLGWSLTRQVVGTFPSKVSTARPPKRLRAVS